MSEQPMYREAVISDDQRYRYTLYREWTMNIMESVRVLNFVMLNPSTADAEIEDATVRKCIGFARRNNFNALRVVNLFALRSTDPQRLQVERVSGADIVGPNNDAYVAEIPLEETVVIAWGSTFKDKAWIKERKAKTLELLKRPCFCVKQTGEPWHPLYVPYGKLLIYGQAEVHSLADSMIAKATAKSVTSSPEQEAEIESSEGRL